MLLKPSERNLANKKRGLGRGLSALIPEEDKIEIRENVLTEAEHKEKVVNMDINKIVPNREQPRREFDKENLEALAQSIKIHGVIQPIIVKPVENGYEIIAGERRLRASKMAGKDSVPCIIRDVEEIASAQLALIENLQRDDLNPIEEAMAYQNLTSKYKITQEKLSIAVGKSRSYITNTMRLLKLNDEVIELINSNRISSGHGKVILSIEDEALQKKVANHIAEKDLSVREAEKYVKQLLEPNNQEIKAKSNKNPQVKHYEEELIAYFGTKVNVKDKNGKGKIEIEYYNLDDFERIIELLELNKE